MLRQWKHALHNLPFWPAAPILCQFITENGSLSFSLPTEVSKMELLQYSFGKSEMTSNTNAKS